MFYFNHHFLWVIICLPNAINSLAYSQVQLAYSKIWKHRQDALEKVMGEISVDDGKLTFESEPKAIVRATTLLLKKMLQDNVVTVCDFIYFYQIHRFL